MSAIKTFEDLQQYMCKFLLGEVRQSPWYSDTIDDETIPLVPQLIKIINRKFITIESQPHNECQRSYISGIMPNHMIDQFIDRLKNKPLVVIRYIGDQPIIHSEYKHIEINNRINVTMIRHDKKDNKSLEYLRNLGKYAKRDLQFTKTHIIEHVTNISTVHNYDNVYDCIKGVVDDQAVSNTSSITILSVDYNTDGLFEMVYQALAD